MSAKKYPDIQPADKYGEWTVLSAGHYIYTDDPHPRKYAYCVCSCGTVDFVLEQNLKNGQAKSCGCRGSRKKVFGQETEPDVKPKRERKGTRPRLVEIWLNMRSRCYKSFATSYKNYGAKGITICDEWRNSYKTFEAWALSHGYADDLSIDRIDGTKGYYPENCRWATAEQQANNLSTNRNLTYNGKTQSMARWSRELGIPTSTIYNRVLAGLSDEEILTLPKNYHQTKQRKAVI